MLRADITIEIGLSQYEQSWAVGPDLINELQGRLRTIPD
jgi:hypothetical protein